MKRLRKTMVLALAAALLAAAPATAAEEISGQAVPLDGDTIWIEGAGKVRLWGLDAPEMRDWPWGPLARGALDELIGDARVVCLKVGQHKNRAVALCQREGERGLTLGEMMVAEGWAVSYRTFTTKPPAAAESSARLLLELEALARKNRRGVWAAWPGLKASRPPPE